MNQSCSSRNPAMDVIRCLALFGVNSVHFFIYTGFYETLLIGPRMFLFTLIRSASMICVPLFLLLSGYLMKNKSPSRGYYSKLIKTVCLYVLASGCCFLYKNGLSCNPLDFILSTLNYTASAYAWYMNMYFGLFLLIPYLNVLYNGLSSERKRRNLILTLLLMTSVTGIINCFQYSPDSGWQPSAIVTIYQIILPDWWQKIYPLTYYFLGAYLKDHPLKLSRGKNLLFVLLAVVGNGVINFLISHNQEFISGAWQDWGSILNIAQSVLLFNYLSQTKFSLPAGASRLLSRASGLTLSAFLVSWMFDEIVYTALHRIQPVTAYKLLYYPVTTATVFLASLLLSWLLDSLYTTAAKGLRLLFPQRNPV